MIDINLLESEYAGLCRLLLPRFKDLASGWKLYGIDHEAKTKCSAGVYSMAVNVSMDAPTLCALGKFLGVWKAGLPVHHGSHEIVTEYGAFHQLDGRGVVSVARAMRGCYHRVIINDIPPKSIERSTDGVNCFVGDWAQEVGRQLGDGSSGWDYSVQPTWSYASKAAAVNQLWLRRTSIPGRYAGCQYLHPVVGARSRQITQEAQVTLYNSLGEVQDTITFKHKYKK